MSERWIRFLGILNAFIAVCIGRHATAWTIRTGGPGGKPIEYSDFIFQKLSKPAYPGEPNTSGGFYSTSGIKYVQYGMTMPSGAGHYVYAPVGVGNVPADACNHNVGDFLASTLCLGGFCRDGNLYCQDNGYYFQNLGCSCTQDAADFPTPCWPTIGTGAVNCVATLSHGTIPFAATGAVYYFLECESQSSNTYQPYKNLGYNIIAPSAENLVGLIKKYGICTFPACPDISFESDATPGTTGYITTGTIRSDGTSCTASFNNFNGVFRVSSGNNDDTGTYEEWIDDCTLGSR